MLAETRGMRWLPFHSFGNKGGYICITRNLLTQIAFATHRHFRTHAIMREEIRSTYD